MTSQAVVSLHPVAARDGSKSATYVSVQAAAPSPIQSQPQQSHSSHNEQASHSRAQSYPQFHPQHFQQTHSHSFSSSSASAQASSSSSNPSSPQANSPEWGLQHSDLEQYAALDELLVQRSSASSSSSTSHSPPPSHQQQAPLPSIRAISSSQFADLQRQHAECDVPHSILFPFLHGVDGENVAQNLFFSAPINGQPSPHYRGLTIVRADMPAPGHRVFTPNHRKRASSSASRLNGGLGGISGMTASGGRNRADSLATTASSTYSNTSDDDWAYQQGGQSQAAHLLRREGGGVPGSGSTASISSSLDSYSHQSSNSLFSTSDGGSESKTSIYNTSADASLVLDGNGTHHLNQMAAARRRKHRSSPVYDPQPKHSILNSTIFPAELLDPPTTHNEKSNGQFEQEGATFLQPRQANGVSLRNFKIQCTKYAAISDIVIYCPAGLHEGAIELADWFRQAQQNWWEERCDRGLGGLRYNVFVVTGE